VCRCVLVLEMKLEKFAENWFQWRVAAGRVEEGKRGGAVGGGRENAPRLVVAMRKGRRESTYVIVQDACILCYHT